MNEVSERRETRLRTDVGEENTMVDTRAERHAEDMEWANETQQTLGRRVRYETVWNAEQQSQGEGSWADNC